MNILYIIKLLLLSLPLAASFAPYPLQEHAYSAKTLADLSGCSEILTQIPRLAEPDKFGEVKMDYYPRLQPTKLATKRQQLKHVRSITDVLTSCLSPFENSAVPCPFDPYSTLLIDEHVVREAKAQVQRIQEIVRLVDQALDVREEFYLTELIITFQWNGRDADSLFRRAWLLEHESHPSLEEAWNSLCSTPIQLGTINPPSQVPINIPEIGYDAIVDLACTMGMFIIVFGVFMLMFIFYGVYGAYLWSPMVRRQVRRGIAYNYHALDQVTRWKYTL